MTTDVNWKQRWKYVLKYGTQFFWTFSYNILQIMINQSGTVYNAYF